jgi:hypothetical protein
LQRSGPNWIGADRQEVELEFIMARSCQTRSERATGFAASN